MMKSPALLILLVASIGWGADDTPKGGDPPKPLTCESLREWHKHGGLQDYHWPKEHHADLDGNGSEEVFLGISGYGRGMTYALFTKTTTGWILLSDQINGSHQPFEVLPEKHAAWHDFRSLSPSGRGGLLETIYTWNGTQYVEKSSREVTETELRAE